MDLVSFSAPQKSAFAFQNSAANPLWAPELSFRHATNLAEAKDGKCTRLCAAEGLPAGSASPLVAPSPMAGLEAVGFGAAEAGGALLRLLWELGGLRYHFVHLQEYFGEGEPGGTVPLSWDIPMSSAAFAQPSTWKQLSSSLGKRWSPSLAGN